MERDRRYIRSLLLLFFAAMLGEVLLSNTGLDMSARRLVLWVLTSAALFFMLAARVRYLGASRYWTLTAVAPQVAFMVAIGLYFESPREAVDEADTGPAY